MIHMLECSCYCLVMIIVTAQAVIEETVRAQLADQSVVHVVVSEDEDFDGDKIFNVNVVVDNEDTFDASSLYGLVPKIRAKLQEIDEFKFPIVRMLTRRDMELLLDAAQ